MSLHRRAFLRFHAENPDVYVALVRLARQWQTARGGRQAIEMLFDVLRWEVGIRTTGDPYRLNDHYCAWYARLIMHREPDLAGVFELRASEADLFGEPDPAQVALWEESGRDLTWLDEACRALDDEREDGPAR